jgi:2-polyprenyl-3-methyl-5-hydroxy-6-metoxy-1,4-benzoquinol methylase
MNNIEKGIGRIDRVILERIINKIDLSADIPRTSQAEMAIPSYLNWNPLVRSIFWRRYDKVYGLAEFSPEMVVCELGCGIGVFLPMLVQETAKVYAVDLFPQYAQELTKQFDLDVIFSTNLEYVPDNSLDVLFAVEVLEHFDELEAGIQLITRKLKQGGQLIISGPTENLLYKTGRFVVGYNKYHEYHRNNIYGIRQAILDAGYTLERTINFPSGLILLNLICSFRVNK